MTSSAVADEMDGYESDVIFDLPVEEWPDGARPDEIIEEGNEGNQPATLALRSFLPLVLK